MNVAGHSDIDEEHGAVAAALEQVLGVFTAEEGLRRARGSQNDVGLVRSFMQLRKRDSPSAEAFRQLLRPLRCAVGDDDVLCSVRDQVARGQLRHFARADQVNRLVFERSEDLLRQLHGHGRNGDAGTADRRLRAHAFGHSEGAGEQRLQGGVDRADAAGHGIRLLHLPQNLRFAHHHRVQAGGHAKNVAHGFALLKFIDMRSQKIRAYAKVDVEKASQVGVLPGAGEHLHAVAGGEDHTFFDARLLHQGADRVRQLRVSHRQAFAYLKRRAVVVYADEMKVHGAKNLCVWLKLLAAHASTAAANANVARYAARRPRQPAFHLVYSSTIYTTHIRPESRILGSAKKRVP